MYVIKNHKNFYRNRKHLIMTQIPWMMLFSTCWNKLQNSYCHTPHIRFRFSIVCWVHWGHTASIKLCIYTGEPSYYFCHLAPDIVNLDVMSQPMKCDLKFNWNLFHIKIMGYPVNSCNILIKMSSSISN